MAKSDFIGYHGVEVGVSARNFVGYGGKLPDPRWPKGAKVAVNIVINYEEGSEPSVLDGDGYTDEHLTEMEKAAPGRDLAAESMFEYGSRVGFWRVLAEIDRAGVPATIFACAQALQRNPPATDAIRQRMADGRLDICAHGLRWEAHHDMTEEVERKKIADACRILKELLGEAPQGWFCRPAWSANTRRLLLEHGGFAYDSDAFNDELPYYVPTGGGGAAHLVVPYSLCTNDSKFAPGRDFSLASDYFEFMRDAFDVLYEEGEAGAPKMMNLGLHCRLIGTPARILGLRRFLEHVKSKGDGVWVAKRGDIADHWRQQYPPPTPEGKKRKHADGA